MASRLTFNIIEEEPDQIFYVRLSGIIDEDNNLSEITKHLCGKIVVINTSEVERINSCGVREWMLWLAQLSKNEITLFFVECSPAIIAQVNLVDNFLGSGTIVNFFSPYYCQNCDSDKVVRIDMGKAKGSTPFKAPTCNCDQCGRVMEFDDIEGSYFGFLQIVDGKIKDPVLVERIKSFSHSAESKVRARAVGSNPFGSAGTKTRSS